MRQNILLAAVVLVISYLVAEMAAISLDLFEPPQTAELRRYHSEFLVANPRYGFRVAANLRGLRISWMNEQIEGIVFTDDKGFRNVGDSFTFGSWVDRDATFSDRSRNYSTAQSHHWQLEDSDCSSMNY